mmetsp:Transcript_5386/g.9111  ORF Transcript_5386/g.9111 Transcript_5386/m.9111 type:complete len:106 (-) Transcript_5386:208-525(-)
MPVIYHRHGNKKVYGWHLVVKWAPCHSFLDIYWCFSLMHASFVQRVCTVKYSSENASGKPVRALAIQPTVVLAVTVLQQLASAGHLQEAASQATVPCLSTPLMQP